METMNSVQSFSRVWLCDPMDCSTAGFSISQSLHKLVSVELVMPSNHLILCCPLLLLSSIFPNIRVFSNELALHTRWPKYWSFSSSISPSSEYSGLICCTWTALILKTALARYCLAYTLVFWPWPECGTQTALPTMTQDQRWVFGRR